MLLLAAGPAAAQAVFPGADWQEATPASQGLDAAMLQAAVDYLKANAPFDGVNELAIVRNGYLIWKGPSIDKRHGIWSCTKSFTSTVLGLLVDDGKTALDTKVATLLSTMSATYPAVTFRHFTTMTSGYRADGDTTTGGYTHGPSPTPFSPSTTPLFTPPGSKYAYWDSAMNQFANGLTRAAGEPLKALFKRRIADPIGMKATDWDWGNWGTIDGIVVNGGAGNGDRHVFITARQFARLGLLFLNRGKWNGNQLLGASWVDQATTVQVASSVPMGSVALSPITGPGVYGFNWWRNGVKADGQRKWPGAPTSTYAASGHNNNDMFVVPDWNLVVVRMGLDEASGFAITDATYGTFLQKIGQSIGAAPPPPTSAPAVTGFTLINADTDQPIGALAGGATLNLAALPTRNLNVRADTSPAAVGSVRFGLDGNANFRTESAAPYALAGDSGGNYAAWTPSVGPHSLTATPYTGSGATGTAGTPKTVSFTVVDQSANQPPSVSLTSPANGATFSAGSSITLAASASDPDGAVAFVDFFQGATLLGMDSAGPYSYTWNNVAAGTYTLTARATDNATATGTSAPVTITVQAAGGAMSVTGFTLVNADTDADLGALADGATLNLAALPTRRLNVRATTSPSTVGSVRFAYDGNAAYRVENAAPYALAGDSAGDYAPWTPTIGSHSLTATPYGQAGAGGTAGASRTVGFTVVDQPGTAALGGAEATPVEAPAACGALGFEAALLLLAFRRRATSRRRPAG
jgi:CubicO group peptidase (beta-lactamase class C family)